MAIARDARTMMVTVIDGTATHLDAAALAAP
jgi:hypothetical protein